MNLQIMPLDSPLVPCVCVCVRVHMRVSVSVCLHSSAFLPNTATFISAHRPQSWKVLPCLKAACQLPHHSAPLFGHTPFLDMACFCCCLLPYARHANFSVLLPPVPCVWQLINAQPVNEGILQLIGD